MEAVGSELNLFQAPLLQSAVQNEFVQEFAPVSTIIQGAPMEFQIEGRGRNYLDLNNTKLEVKVKLVDASDGKIDGATKVSVANLPLHSLFSTAIVKVADKVVTESNNLNAYRALFETILNYQNEVLKTRMKCEGYEQDTAEQMDDTNPASAGKNEGLKAREAKFNGSSIVRLIGRPHLDIFHQEKLIPPGVKLEIQLVPARPSFFIKTAKPEGGKQQVLYKFHIVSARFLVAMKEISPSMVLAHQKMLQQVNFQIPHTKVSLKTQTIPTGVMSYTLDNLFKGKLPDRIVLGMVSDQAATGSYTANPFNFQNFGLNYLALKVNSELVPRIPLEPNFAGNDYLREYLTVLEGMGYDIGPNTWSISPTEWANGYNIYVFKITPGQIGTVNSSPLMGDIRLEMKFASQTTANTTLIVLSEEPGLLEIDKFNHVFVS